MKVNDLVVEKTSTEYDYTIMFVAGIKDEIVTCTWVNDAGRPELKLFVVKELEIFIKD